MKVDEKKSLSRERVYIIYERENKNELGNRFLSTIYTEENSFHFGSTTIKTL